MNLDIFSESIDYFVLVYANVDDIIHQKEVLINIILSSMEKAFMISQLIVI